ncbi:MAG TPA: 2-dehydropantoate 2-reductase [Thermoanaerobaculia bacterium]|nr:2-dehydropantoate 2-reductase [Thermoanaerobaculia bacterium]
MRIHVLGTGALGCFFGARLARVAGVTLVGTWMEALDAIAKSGIVLEAAGAEQAVPVKTARLGAPLEAADLVLVLVKAWQTERVARMVPDLTGPCGYVLTLQNGLGNLEKLGPRAFLGVTEQGATLLAPGRVRPCGDGPTHIAGPESLAEVFRSAGLDARAVDPALGDSLAWGKLAVNAGINALSAILRVPNGQLLAQPEALALLEGASNEVAEVARAKGIALPFPDAAAETRRVARATASNLSSTLQDVLRGAPTEIDAINGAVVREGARLGVRTPANETLLRLLAARVAA